MKKLARYSLALFLMVVLAVACKEASQHTRFGVTQNNQLGPSGIAIYTNAAALTADTSQFAPGTIVSLVTPQQLLISSQVKPANGQYVSASSWTGPNGVVVTTYWTVYPSNASIAGQSTEFTARVAPLSITAYTGTGTGTLTITTAAAWTADGVVIALGDQIFLQPGLTNLLAIDSGPWVDAVLGTGSVSTVLVRPYWWFTGNKWASGATVTVGGEGTTFANTKWRATHAAAVIDTTDPAFYVERYTFLVTLASGVNVLAAGQPAAGILAASAKFPIGIWSESQSNLLCTLNNPTTGTGGALSYSYGPMNSTYRDAGISSLVAGYVGTASAEVYATKVGMATNTIDASTLACTLENF